MCKWLSIVALSISAASIALSAWTYHQADARAEEALQRREKALVEKYKPDVERVYKDFGMKTPQDPQTLDELFGPLIKMLCEPLSKT